MPSTIAVDLAKTVFQVALATRAGRITQHRRLSRAQFDRFLRETAPALVVMEACGTAHHWGRVAQAAGHEVRLLPPKYVRPYVRRNKTDRADAAALLEALRNPAIRPVPVKSVAQQELVGLHRIRDQWMATRTARLNTLRGLLREQGVVLPVGARRALADLPTVLADAATPLPAALRHALAALYTEIRELEQRVASLEDDLARLAAPDPVVQRLQTVPGIGLLTATALRGSVGSIAPFRRARRFASRLGLTARERSSGTRRRLGSITKQGDVYLRCLLVHGARAALLAAQRRHRAGHPLSRLQQWAVQVAARRGHNRATVALANKLARLAWAVWSRDEPYRAQAPPAGGVAGTSNPSPPSPCGVSEPLMMAPRDRLTLAQADNPVGARRRFSTIGRQGRVCPSWPGSDGFHRRGRIYDCTASHLPSPRHLLNPKEESI